MADYFDSLAQKFLSKSSLQECSIDEIRNIANQYPYFAPAQYLLLKKLDRNSDEYRQQYSKAILYYNNPLEFEQLFHPEKWNTVIDLETEVADEDDLYEETSIAHEIIEEEDKTVEIKNQPEENVSVEKNFEEVDIEEQKEVEQPVIITEEKTQVAEISIQNFVEEKIEEPVTIESQEAAIDAEEENTSELPPLPKLEIKETAPDENALAFEPFHTVDYFASQGIKLSQEVGSNDVLGKQLKSFTEWLKTMKRLPANKTVENIDPNTEKKVENLASHSVEDPHIATEAMAEVWVKQGNIEKAIEVYNKLSLSNPSKNAYFAAKIQNLKNRS